MNEYARLIALQQELARRQSRKRFFTYFPDTGPLRRDLYQKHLAFFRAGATFRERAAIAANRVGKTEGMGGYEMTCHLTGLYPDWWEGKRFDHPVDAWASGDTSETVRDIIQQKLVGPPEKEEEWGTGLIPGDLLIGFTQKSHGVKHALESVMVRHVSGGVSVLGFKSYEQGRKKFQGTAKHVIWNDEEPPEDVYDEELLRTMTCGGIVMNTFTPLSGITAVVLRFMPGGKSPEVMDVRFSVQADWDDVPHLDQKTKDELYAALPPRQREARSKGIPVLGAGAIYPVEEDFIKVPDFIIPAHWPRSFGFDVGWNNTAAVWGALDRETDTGYLYACYKRGQAEPPIHAGAIKAKGDWIPGVIDPASRGGSQKDGEKLLNLYQDEKLTLSLADNAVEAGIHDVWTALSTGKLKVFKSLALWFDEFRLYRRSDNGKGTIVKVNDHLMDCTRYWWRSGRQAAITRPVVQDPGAIIGDYHKKSAMCA